jgi:hypothetical protein
MDCNFNASRWEFYPISFPYSGMTKIIPYQPLLAAAEKRFFPHKGI